MWHVLDFTAQVLAQNLGLLGQLNQSKCLLRKYTQHGFRFAMQECIIMCTCFEIFCSRPMVK